jgi:hypothetical protein
LSTNYHTQHSPFGAFASFTIGLHHSPGGFGIALGAPANQNIYAGFRVKNGIWNLLPFFRETKSLAAAFTTDQIEPVEEIAAPAAYRRLNADDFTRRLGWASDTWASDRFSFSIFSPFDHVPDEQSLSAFVTAPVIAAELEYDNTNGGEEVEVIFGMNETAQPSRPLPDVAPRLSGFATGRRYGYASGPAEGLRAVQGHTVLSPSPAFSDGFQRIGGESALILRIPAGAKARLPLALGFYEAGIVTTGLDCRYYYTRHFSSLEEVLAFGLERHADYVALAQKRDAELAASNLSGDQRWLIAQATHSYLGSSQLLDHDGAPLWNVNEGEYRMINTFDLTVDHLFFELQWHPWAMRNALDLFVARYSYRDTLQWSGGAKAEGGISFTHDMGVTNQFSPPGLSSYECTGLHGCFSHMTMEQLVNWVLCAVSYAMKTGDHAWLRASRETLLACKESLEHRDDPDPARRTGILKWDSARCGGGSEITTYDSLDESLGQARNNLYLAVKTLAAWLLLECAFDQLGLPDPARDSAATADKLAKTLTDQFEIGTGFFPAVFEKGNRSRILPAIEGLVFPLYLGMDAALARDGRFAKLLDQFEQHMTNALQPGICIDARSGGWKLSSTSCNTWMSKIGIAQHVTRRLFPNALSDAARSADRVHAGWQQNPGCGAMAMCDQIQSQTGVAIGSKYYPRIVTAILWMSE